MIAARPPLSAASYGRMSMTLPGVDRKRSPQAYSYRVSYRAPDSGEVGCVMTWQVSGGRSPYQVALERLDSGRLKWHCTCADMVYRGEDDTRHHCKHVAGLRAILPPGA